MDCPCPIMSVLPHVVVANQALHDNTKVRGPGVEATLKTSLHKWLLKKYSYIFWASSKHLLHTTDKEVTPSKLGVRTRSKLLLE